MKRMIENITGNYAASATVVDGTLIISLPDAITPVIWRLDLGQAKASALEVRPLDNGTFMLMLKTPRGDVNNIAPFETKARAVAALMAVSRAMQNSHGQLRPVAASDGMESYDPSRLPVPVRQTRRKTHPGEKKNWAAGVFALLLIAMLVGILVNMGPRSVRSLSPASGEPRQQAAAQSTGVPMSADEFLKNR